MPEQPAHVKDLAFVVKIVAEYMRKELRRRCRYGASRIMYARYWNSHRCTGQFNEIMDKRIYTFIIILRVPLAKVRLLHRGILPAAAFRNNPASSCSKPRHAASHQ